MKKFTTFLPKNWLAETPRRLALKRLGRRLGGKGADFWIQTNCRER
ncbi:hypothetical protein [Peribacillus simplex]